MFMVMILVDMKMTLIKRAENGNLESLTGTLMRTMIFRSGIIVLMLGEIYLRIHLF